MYLAFFYEHAFVPGGAPVGIRHLTAALARRHRVTVWGRRPGDGDAALFPDDVDCRTYGSIPGLLADMSTAERPDVLVVAGFFLAPNAPVVALARRRGIPVVLHPLAQVWPAAFQGKIFTHGCDVRTLEDRRTNRDRLRQRLLDRLSPLAKRTYRRTAGRLLAEGSTRIAVLSSEERRQFQREYPRPDADFLVLPWGIDALSGRTDEPGHYFRDALGLRDARPNFIVWSRLDWYYKGLDRLLLGVRAAKRRSAHGALPFRLFLCGPDYREGSVRAARFVEANGLQDDVDILLPDRYRPGSLAPLRDADASVLLSPWAGAPRALRESLALGTPIVVSPETNFGDLVRAHACGEVVDAPDDPESVADALLTLADPARREAARRHTAGLATYLDWSRVAERLAGDFADLLPAALPAPALAS